MYRRILVATDGSELSIRAAQKGMDFTKLFNARLQILYVIDQRVFFFPHEVQELTTENPYFTIMEELMRNANEVLDSLKTTARKKGVEFEALIREGSVIDLVLDSIRQNKSDLLIIGAHGKTGQLRGNLGSTAHSLVGLSPCSLLIVREK